MKNWDGPRVGVEWRIGKRQGRRIPLWAVTNERRSQSPFYLAPSTVALILVLACVARMAEIAADIGPALRVLANAKIHGNATRPNISTVS